jgi:hypothetical protein
MPISIQTQFAEIHSTVQTFHVVATGEGPLPAIAMPLPNERQVDRLT